MKATVNKNMCIGCGLCDNICHEVFRMEGDKAVVIVDLIPQNIEVSCKQAADECPVAAILLQ